jgi:hypothetical protein
MIHVFLLMVYLGVGDDRQLISNDMYFHSVIDCNFFAKEITRRYGNYRDLYKMDSRDRVTAYCIPKHIDKDSVKVY